MLNNHRLKQQIEQYITYFYNKRIKQKLTGMSQVQYRTYPSQLAA
nr:IS3 family transposase [Planococcus halocryophilus]